MHVFTSCKSTPDLSEHLLDRAVLLTWRKWMWFDLPKLDGGSNDIDLAKGDFCMFCSLQVRFPVLI